jgi:phospholipid/cholesterol/gamma-HCH transport system substrate-binding protein
MFLLGALVIFALATFYIENWQFYLKEGYQLRACFPKVLDLSEGDEVKVAGVEVGRVQDISINTEIVVPEPVTVTMWISRGVKVREGDVARVEIRSIFGGSYISIYRTDPAARVLKPGEMISNVEVSNSVAEVVQQTHTVLGDISSAMDDARVAVAKMKTIAEKIERGEGTVGKLLLDEEMGQKMEKIVADVSSFSDTMRDVARKIQDRKSIAGKFLVDEEEAEKFELMLADARKVAREMSEFSEKFQDSTLGRLASGGELYEKLDRAMDDLNVTLAALAEGKGTIGKLIQNPEVYHELVAVMQGGRQILEEYREQSPILTFAGAIFGAF